MAHGKILTGAALFLAVAGFSSATQASDGRAHVDASIPADLIYPASSQDAGEQGAVVLNVHVRSNGQLSRVAVAESSGYPDLDAAAVETALGWHYVPASHDGDAASDEIAVRVVYKLPKVPAAR